MFENVLTMKPTRRIESIREAYFQIKPTASIERARIETRVMKETEGEFEVTRRAKVFAALVREMPIHIFRNQLLVGCTSVRPRCVNITPTVFAQAARREAAQSGLLGMREDIPAAKLSDDEVRELEAMMPYWRSQGRINNSSHYGHNIHGHEQVLKKGFLGIKKDAEDRLARLDLGNPEDISKIPFLKGVILAMEAAAEFGKRFASLARELADKEKICERKEELLRIAKVCDWVPANPARTFHEALQSYYFSYLLLFWEALPNDGFTEGRMDQYLYPYYQSDMKEGRITKEEAQELIDCYFLSVNYETGCSRITVGGIKANGNDATNDLSYMFIEAMMHTRLAIPWLSVLVHHQMADDLLIKACQLSSLGTGHPHFINNDVMVLQALARGSSGGPAVTLEDARNASPQGCGELVIPGKDSGYLFFRMPNLAACMEFVLTNGSRRSGLHDPVWYKPFTGIETGDPRQFKSFEEVQEAFHKQVTWMRENIQIDGTNRERNIVKFTPTVYESALIDDCIEKGMYREAGGAHYNFNNGGAELGTTDAGDSLTAIRKLVFDDKKITMAELCDALDHNFEGYDDIRKICLEAPKFGNDDDYADEQVAWVIHEWASEFNKLTNLRGGSGGCGASSMGMYIPEGTVVGALPSGRLAGVPLADGASPSPGKDINGVTAVLKSLGKVDNIEVLGSLVLNIRIDPTACNDGDVSRLASLIRSFIDQKLYHLNINVVSTEILKAAQEEPEKYRDLMVKVAGYNVFFTQLNKPIQESIIARTTHRL